MPTTRPIRHQQTLRIVSEFRFFPATEQFLNDYNFTVANDVATRIISTCRTIIASTHDEQVKNQWQEVIKKVSTIVQSMSLIAKHAEISNHDWETEDVNLVNLEVLFEELQTIILSLPKKTQPESGFAATSSTIAGVCFYLLVLSASITIGAAFGAWYFGLLSASYFVNMLISSLAYFDIPTMLLGLVAYGVYASQSTATSELNPVADDALLLFENCKSAIEHFKPSEAVEEDGDEEEDSLSLSN